MQKNELLSVYSEADEKTRKLIEEVYDIGYQNGYADAEEKYKKEANNNIAMGMTIGNLLG